MLLGLAQNVGVLDAKSADKLHIVTILIDEEVLQRGDTVLFVVLVQQHRWLKSHQELDLSLSEAVAILQVLLKLDNFFH